MTDYRWAIEEMQEICEDYINTWNPEVVQVADELQYEYDYGDGWTVRITCEEGYTSEWEEDNFDYTSASGDEVFSHILSIDEEAKFVDSDGQRVSDEMQATLESIFYEGRDQLMLGFMARVENNELSLSSEVEQGKWFDIDSAIKTVREGSIIQKLITDTKDKLL